MVTIPIRPSKALQGPIRLCKLTAYKALKDEAGAAHDLLATRGHDRKKIDCSSMSNCSHDECSTARQCCQHVSIARDHTLCLFQHKAPPPLTRLSGIGRTDLRFGLIVMS